MADKGHLYADRRIDVIERELKVLYGRTEAEIEETASRYFGQLERLDKQKKELVESGRLTEEEYKTWRKNKLTYGKRFTEMKEECARQLLNVNRTALEYVNAELAGVYAVNYNQFGKQAMKEVKGYSFTLLSADTVRRLALNDKSLLPYKKLDPSKDVPWNMKKINSEVLQGILQGESTDKIAKRISRVQEMNRTAAVRTARTLVTEAECKGRQDSYVKATDDGIILERKWIAAHDARIRHWHADLDGKTAKTDEPFENAYGKIMYPGDRTAHPANVYNCRCTIAAVVKGFKKAGNYLTNSDKPDIIKAEDTKIGKTVGAKAKNYNVTDPESGELLKFAEGTVIKDTQIFAGHGVKKQLKEEVVEGLTKEFGGVPARWQHAKGTGILDFHGEELKAEVHWFQEESVGKVKFKVKKWLE